MTLNQNIQVMQRIGRQNPDMTWILELVDKDTKTNKQRRIEDRDTGYSK